MLVAYHPRSRDPTLKSLRSRNLINGLTALSDVADLLHVPPMTSKAKGCGAEPRIAGEIRVSAGDYSLPMCATAVGRSRLCALR
jgi:hypothetical protein